MHQGCKRIGEETGEEEDGAVNQKESYDADANAVSKGKAGAGKMRKRRIQGPVFQVPRMGAQRQVLPQ